MERNCTKSEEISELLRNEILSGKFDGTNKLPSEHQLMRRFSVARETVRAAIMNLQGKHLVDRRPGCGTFLSAGATMRAREKIGLIVPESEIDFYWRICRGVEERAHARGWSVLTAPCGYGTMRERFARAMAFVDVCVRERVAGVLVQPVQFLKDSLSLNRGLCEALEHAGLQIGLIDSDYLEFPERSDYDITCSDSFVIGHRLARHVISRGARRIVYLAYPFSAPTAFNRVNGIANAVLDAGLPWGEGNVIFGFPTDMKLMRRVFLSKSRPDAVICTGDSIAADLLPTLAALGLRVPEDVLVAGVNGDMVGAQATPPVTTAVQPCHQIGCAAFDMLLERIRDPGLAPRTQMFNAQVVVRKSTDRRSERGSRKSARTARKDRK